VIKLFLYVEEMEWNAFCRAYAKDNNLSYRDSMISKDCRLKYHKSKGLDEESFHKREEKRESNKAKRSAKQREKEIEAEKETVYKIHKTLTAAPVEEAKPVEAKKKRRPPKEVLEKYTLPTSSDAS